MKQMRKIIRSGLDVEGKYRNSHVFVVVWRFIIIVASLTFITITPCLIYSHTGHFYSRLRDLSQTVLRHEYRFSPRRSESGKRQGDAGVFEYYCTRRGTIMGLIQPLTECFRSRMAQDVPRLRVQQRLQPASLRHLRCKSRPVPYLGSF